MIKPNKRILFLLIFQLFSLSAFSANQCSKFLNNYQFTKDIFSFDGSKISCINSKLAEYESCDTQNGKIIIAGSEVEIFKDDKKGFVNITLSWDQLIYKHGEKFINPQTTDFSSKLITSYSITEDGYGPNTLDIRMKNLGANCEIDYVDLARVDYEEYSIEAFASLADCQDIDEDDPDNIELISLCNQLEYSSKKRNSNNSKGLSTGTIRD